MQVNKIDVKSLEEIEQVNVERNETKLNGNSISSGCFYYYSVERTLLKKLPQPYNNCYKDVSLFSFNRIIGLYLWFCYGFCIC